MSVRSSAGAAVSRRARVSLNRLFSRRIWLTGSSPWDRSVIEVKCICIASACSIWRDHTTRSWAWSSSVLSRAVSATVRRLTTVSAMTRNVMSRKPASSLTWTDARIRANARTGAPSGELISAMTGGGVRSEAGARLLILPPARLAGGHLQGDGRRILVAHDDLLRNRTEPLLPHLERVAPGREALELELSGAVREGVVGMLGHYHPAAHPGMQVARHADDLGLLERDRDRAALRLRAVEGRVRARGAVQVVQEPVAVQEVDLPARGHDDDAGREHAFLLVHRRGRRERCGGRAGRRLVEPDDRAPDAALRREDELLRALLLTAHVLVDRHGELLQLGRRPFQRDSALDGAGDGVAGSRQAGHQYEDAQSTQDGRQGRHRSLLRASVYAIIPAHIDHVGSEGSMVSRRVVRSYQARYSMGANKAAMYDLTDAIDVHAHARGHDEEEPLHAAQEASRAGMKAILFKSISPGRPWEVARKIQEDVDRWAERENLRPVKCLSAWVVGIPLKPIDFAEIKAAVEGGIMGMWMPPVTSAWSIYRLGGRGVWFDKARRHDDPVAPVAWDQALKTGMYVLDDHGRLLPAIRDTVRLCADHGV